MSRMRGSSASRYSPSLLIQMVMEIEHDRQRVGERQEVVEPVRDLVVFDRHEIARGLGQSLKACSEPFDAGAARAAMDVDMRAVRVPARAVAKHGEDLGVILELGQRILERALIIGRKNTELVGMGAEAHVGVPRCLAAGGERASIAARRSGSRQNLRASG
jgi:hypothetical protein